MWKRLLVVSAVSAAMSSMALAAPLTVGFSQVGSESGWRAAETNVAKSDAEKRGITLKIADGQQKQENQIKAVRSFVAQGVDAIFIAPVVATGWEPVLKEAKDAEIPVFLLDRSIDVKDKSLYMTTVTADNILEGKLIGDWLVKEVNGKPCNVVELQGTVGASVAIDRKKGFAEAIKNAPNIKIIQVLEAVIKNGARPAEPGEFTKRAFLNGRIDLSQAESVIDVINSKNDFALKSSLSQLGGAVLGSIRQIREQLLHEIAFIESALDDPEHISLDGYPQKLRAIVDNEYVEIDSLLKTSDNGRILKEGINTVIIGKPNAGKSSLLNVLVGTDRAIVTDIAGTTRDVLEEQINIGGITLNLVDTAGIRSTEDVVEKIGVKKAMEHANEADLIIYVVDSSVALDDNDYDIINFIKDKKAIILLNKSDLASKMSADDIKKLVDKTVISVSAKESSGIDELSDTIKEMFFDGQVSFNDEIYITNIRHKKLLSDAKESLKLVMNSIDDDMPEDFYSIDLMSAYESLGLIIGESVEDDLMDEIFSKFCMGK